LTRRPLYIYNNFSLSFSLNEKCFRKRCRENQNTHFMFHDFFPRKLCRLWDSVTKYCTAGHAIDDKMAHAVCLLGNSGYKHTLSLCNVYCFSTTTVARTRLNITLYVHCLSCLFSFYERKYREKIEIFLRLDNTRANTNERHYNELHSNC